jgi:hypothetical protein
MFGNVRSGERTTTARRGGSAYVVVTVEQRAQVPFRIGRRLRACNLPLCFDIKTALCL